MGLKKNYGRYHYDAAFEGIEIMCRIFWGPDTEMCRQIFEKSFFNPFKIVLADSKDVPDHLLDDIVSFADHFKTPEALKDHLEACYIRLFINNTGGITPLYQSCYEFENAPMMGASAQQMAALFTSKGLSLSDGLNEPPDHLSIELEYLLFLLEDGLKSQINDKEKSFQQDAGSFASEVMLPWVTTLCNRLESGPDECRFYLLTTKMLLLLLTFISR